MKIPSLSEARLTRVAGGCVVIALASLLLPTAPYSDAWGWLVWGRELAALDLNTGGTAVVVSWKPLPVLITALLSPFDDLAPELWVALVRAGSLLALALAYRLGHRLAGPVAGATALLGLLLMPNWLGWSNWGLSEPLLAAVALLAVERHLDGHRGQAFTLGLLVALGRPEAAPLVALYGASAWRLEPRKMLRVAAGCVVLLLLWFGVDWLASGSPATGSERASGYGTATAADLRRPAGLLLAPVWLLAVVGIAMAARKAGLSQRAAGERPDATAEARVTLVLGAGALAWIAIVVAMRIVGYAAVARFMVPAGAALCVVAGVGAAWLLRALTARRATRPALIVLSLVALLFAIARVAAIPENAAQRSADANSVDDARNAVQAAGGSDRLLACGAIGSPDLEMQGVLAWELDVSLDDVEVPPRGSRGPLDLGVVLAQSRRDALRVLPSEAEAGSRARLEVLGRSGDWSVFAADCPLAEVYAPSTGKRGVRSPVPALPVA